MPGTGKGSAHPNPDREALGARRGLQRFPGTARPAYRESQAARPGSADPAGQRAPAPAPPPHFPRAPAGIPAPGRTHCCTALPWRSASAAPGSSTAARRGCSYRGPEPAPTPQASSAQKTSSCSHVRTRGGPRAQRQRKRRRGADRTMSRVPATGRRPRGRLGGLSRGGSAPAPAPPGAAALRPSAPPSWRRLAGRAATGRREGQGGRCARARMRRAAWAEGASRREATGSCEGHGRAARAKAPQCPSRAAPWVSALPGLLSAARPAAPVAVPCHPPRAQINTRPPASPLSSQREAPHRRAPGAPAVLEKCLFV